MPLRGGSSQKVISENIHEAAMSPTFAKGKSKEKRHHMAVAMALATAFGPRGKKNKKRGGK